MRWYLPCSWFGSAADAASAEHERLLEGAKKEGRLVLYTGMDTEEANQYMHEFTKKYPFVKPEAFRSSGEKVQARFLIEHRANVHNADIFQASIVQVYQLKNAGLLGKYISDESQVYPEGFKDPLGYWTAFYLIPYVIGHNTKLVSTKDAPSGYEDLLQSQVERPDRFGDRRVSVVLSSHPDSGQREGDRLYETARWAKSANAQRPYAARATRGRG